MAEKTLRSMGKKGVFFVPTVVDGWLVDGRTKAAIRKHARNKLLGTPKVQHWQKTWPKWENGSVLITYVQKCCTHCQTTEELCRTKNYRGKNSFVFLFHVSGTKEEEPQNGPSSFACMRKPIIIIIFMQIFYCGGAEKEKTKRRRKEDLCLKKRLYFLPRKQ